MLLFFFFCFFLVYCTHLHTVSIAIVRCVCSIRHRLDPRLPVDTRKNTGRSNWIRRPAVVWRRYFTRSFSTFSIGTRENRDRRPIGTGEKIRRDRWRSVKYTDGGTEKTNPRVMSNSTFWYPNIECKTNAIVALPRQRIPGFRSREIVFILLNGKKN